MALIIWTRLQDNFPNGITKSNFQPNTRQAKYGSQGKWAFSVSGNITESNLLPVRKYEKTPGVYVETHETEVFSSELKLKAWYYEKPQIIEIIDIVNSNEKRYIETISETPIFGKGLQSLWITWSYSGWNQEINGSVKNMGIVPLQDVYIEMRALDYQGQNIWSKKIKIISDKTESNIMQPDETGHYFYQEKIDLPASTSYVYQFLTSTGELLKEYVEKK